MFVHPHESHQVSVDDCLWFSKDGAALDKLIAQMKELMDLTVKGNDESAFMEIQFTRREHTVEDD